MKTLTEKERREIYIAANRVYVNKKATYMCSCIREALDATYDGFEIPINELTFPEFFALRPLDAGNAWWNREVNRSPFFYILFRMTFRERISRDEFYRLSYNFINCNLGLTVMPEHKVALDKAWSCVSVHKIICQDKSILVGYLKEHGIDKTRQQIDDYEKTYGDKRWLNMIKDEYVKDAEELDSSPFFRSVVFNRTYDAIIKKQD